MKLLFKILPILIVLTVISTVALAQTPPPGGGTMDAPLDGLTGLLLIAGVGYGSKKIRGVKK